MVGVLAGATTFGVFLVSLFFGVTSMMRSSDAYRMTLEAGGASPCVINSIGTPLKPGWWITGGIETHDNDGSANLVIPIRGPKGNGELSFESKKADGVWHIQSLDFESGNGRMQLIPEPAGAACAIVNPTYRDR